MSVGVVAEERLAERYPCDVTRLLLLGLDVGYVLVALAGDFGVAERGLGERRRYQALRPLMFQDLGGRLRLSRLLHGALGARACRAEL